MAVAQGGDDYVEKPFRLEVLKAKIEAMLRRTYHYQMRVQEYLKKDLYFDCGQSVLVCQNRWDIDDYDQPPAQQAERILRGRADYDEKRAGIFAAVGEYK